ncbi:MAG: hypothetical protein VX223_03625 [Myxococcota bacterium]|nr:hypothetical protein [Myxococcota bacterium]
MNTAVVIVLVIHGLSYPSHSSGSAGLGTSPSADARNEGIPDASEQMTIDAVIPAADIPLLDVGTAVEVTQDLGAALPTATVSQFDIGLMPDTVSGGSEDVSSPEDIANNHRPVRARVWNLPSNHLRT